MNELELLLENRWILKNKHKELYYRIRDEVGELRKFATDKLGCQIIENSEDFYESDWLNMDQDRGMIRRHRVYKRILFQPGMFREVGQKRILSI